MVYRVNWKNFLIHMIDWFSFQDLMEMNWLIMSVPLGTNGTNSRIVKSIQLYPGSEIVDLYVETQDYETAKKMYFDQLTKPDDDDDEITASLSEITVYQYVLAPMENFCNVCIICMEDEDWIVDMFCDFIKERLFIDTIDLNRLFQKGNVHGFKLNRNKIRDKGVDLRRMSILVNRKNLEMTVEGRLGLMKKMTKKEKLKKLKKLGIKVHEKDEKKIDQLLMDAWVQSE